MISLEFQGTCDGKSPQRSQHPVPAIVGNCSTQAHWKSDQASSWNPSGCCCHPLLLLKAVPELPSSASCKPSSFQTEFITWNPSWLAFWIHNFNPAGGGSRGWWGFFAFLLLHKSRRTFPWYGEPAAWMKGGVQLSVPAFPPLSAGNSMHYWAFCCFIAAFPSQITFFFCRQSYFLIARFISGQLAGQGDIIYASLSKIPDSPQTIHSPGGHRTTRPNLNMVKCCELQCEEKGVFLLPHAPWVCYDPLTCRINHSLFTQFNLTMIFHIGCTIILTSWEHGTTLTPLGV